MSSLTLKELLTPNLVVILEQYLKLEKLAEYFEMVANRAINKIPLLCK
jgi:hypothetical protein